MTSCPSRALQKHGSEVRKERRAVEAPCNPDDDADVPRELTADEQEAVSLVQMANDCEAEFLGLMKPTQPTKGLPTVQVLRCPPNLLFFSLKK
jgi:hypothetical protein